MIRRKNLLMSMLAMGAIAACSQESALLEKTTVPIGQQGGEIQSADGSARLTIQADALSSLQMISIDVRRVERHGLRSALYAFGPEGLTFQEPVTLAIQVDTHEALVLAHADPARPVPILDSEQSDTEGVVRGSLGHFSMYGIFLVHAQCNADADCLDGQVCDPTTGTCTGDPSQGCNHDGDCPSGQVCDPTTGICIE